MSYVSIIPYLDVEELNVKNENNKSVGKVRRTVGGTVGLGLMRLKESFSANRLSVNDIPLKTNKPKWWPIEKERDTVDDISR